MSFALEGRETVASLGISVSAVKARMFRAPAMPFIRAKRYVIPWRLDESFYA
jgi:hypothetical protein